MSEHDLQQLIAAWLDGRITQSESDELQQRLRESAEARAMFRQFSQLDCGLRELSDGDAMVEPKLATIDDRAFGSTDPSIHRRIPGWAQFAIAAVVLLMVGGIAYRLGKENLSKPEAVAVAPANPEESRREQVLSGYATLRRVADIQWTEGANSFREGDVLPGGILQFESGVAEIDFFSGATLVVEGPAKMNLRSDWSVHLLAGRLRANVPPAAQGFVVQAADSEIIDLGTEFALDVRPQNVRVEVIDGEIKLRGGEHDGQHLTTGQAQSLRGDGSGSSSFDGLSTTLDVQRQHAIEQQRRWNQWKLDSQQLRNDPRLIAYYPIAESSSSRFVPNVANTGNDRDGTMVGLVHRTDGRFGQDSASLEFDRPGSRVRVRMDGDFTAFTFACWVKIDSLEHRYNALFMGDGYENGEPHWQIRDDGCLMFSVMVDDSVNLTRLDKVEQRMVTTAGRHRVYSSQPIWDISKSGQWLHIAAVYDPPARRVTQYVNGQQVADEKITDQFLIEKLRIGPAEIGNWGQPFRKTPWFAVRNLNGSIDELTIFDAALQSDEITKLYEQGKPLGY
ncbi:MAG: LamG-like jellyroll fold domain-containing protein [Rubripirellula sp.]